MVGCQEEKKIVKGHRFTRNLALDASVLGFMQTIQQSIENKSNYVAFIHQNKNKQKPFIIGLHDKTSPKIKLNMS